ncbi:MAG: sulfatase-like hydrolase/transferase [Candidatus Sumerlaeota bacterium]
MSDKPNILFFFTDQQRWDACGCYGQRLDITPNLDRMAAEGVKFNKAYTCQPVCGPARACLQTGKYATEVDVPTNHRMPDPAEMRLAPGMKNAGYEVGYIGKWHLASFGPKDGPDNFRTLPVPPERRGGYSDFWLASDCLEFTSHSYDGYMYDGQGNRRDFPEGRFRADAQTDWVLEYLETRDGEKPWFLMVSYIEPHHQNDHNCYEGPKGSKEKFADYDVPGDLVDTEGDWRENYPDYLGCIHSLDQNLGRIREKLEELGMAENTLIVFTSDHGSHFKTRNGEYKRSCHDGCTHIPMVAWGPGFRGGKEVDAMASLIDVPPTLLHAAGAKIPDPMQGRPLQETVDGTPEDWPEEVFIQISESHCGRAVATKRWKYSVRALEAGNMEQHAEKYIEDFLYDLEEDPHERNNLVDDPQYADVRADMRRRLLKHMRQAHEPEPEITTAQKES